MSIESKVRTEIEALHEFFVGWFTGKLDKSAFEPQCMARFDHDFLLIPPNGTQLGRDDLATGLQAAHGSNPDFRIAIRNVRVLHKLDLHVLATYEEWQRNALASTPADNARIATVLFRSGEPLRWLHVHETWLPDAIAAAGPYDF